MRKGGGEVYTISKLCTLICNEYEKQCIGIHISPIHREEHNFIIINETETLKLFHGSHGTKEFLDFAKEMAPTDCSYADFLQNIAYSKEFLFAYGKKFYKEICLTDDIRVHLSKVNDIDFNVPQTRHGGLDGFSLNYWMLGLEKEFRVWCSHYDDYYAPITDLANALLNAAYVDKKYRFSVIKRI